MTPPPAAPCFSDKVYSWGAESTQVNTCRHMLGLFTGSVGRSAAATHDWTDNREHCWGGALSGGWGPVVLVNACRRTKEFRNVWVGSLWGGWDNGDVGVS